MTPDGTPLTPDQAITVQLQAQPSTPRITLPPTLTLAEGQATVTTEITITADAIANRASIYTIRVALPANTPATLVNTVAKLNITADPVSIGFRPRMLSLAEGSSAQLTIQALSTPLGVIRVALSALGQEGITIQPSNIQISPSQLSAKVTLSLADDEINEPKPQQSIIRLSIVSGPGRPQANYDQAIITIPPSDLIKSAVARFKPSTATVIGQGINEGEQTTLTITTNGLEADIEISIKTSAYLRANISTAVATSAKPSVQFIITALSDNIASLKQRKDTIVATVTGNTNLFLPVIAMDTESDYACGVHQDQTITCWGSDGDTGKVAQAPTTGSYTAITTGRDHSCALNAEQQIVCWGDPGDKLQVPHNRILPPAGRYTSVSAGAYHSCAIRAQDQGLVCWGAYLGQANSRIDISDLPTGRFKALARSIARAHDCALNTNRQAACWGSRLAQVGQPQQALFNHLATGDFISCGIKTDQAIACWGQNNLHNLATSYPGPYQALALGRRALCVINPDQTIACFGSQADTVNDPPPGQYQDLALGRGHACATELGVGTINCWGQLTELPSHIDSKAYLNKQATYTLYTNNTDIAELVFKPPSVNLIEGTSQTITLSLADDSPRLGHVLNLELEHQTDQDTDQLNISRTTLRLGP